MMKLTLSRCYAVCMAAWTFVLGVKHFRLVV